MIKTSKTEKIDRPSPFSLRPSIFYFLFSIFLFYTTSVLAAIPDPAPQPTFLSKAAETLSGYYKTLAGFSKTRATGEGFFSWLQRLRLEFKPRLTEHLDLDIVMDHELLLNDFANTPDFDLIRQKNQKNFCFLDGDKVVSDTDHVYERLVLYRAFLRFESAHSRWLLGKQLIDWGRMRFYSPLDIFNPPLPSDIETEERMGFDALNIELSSDNFSGINLIYGPGVNEDKTSYGLRLYKKIKTYDIFLIAAKHEDEKVAGFGFDGYVGGAGLRGEFTYTKSGKEKYPRAGLGVDYSFPTKTTVSAEYFYNGAANGDVAVFTTSLVESRRRLSLEKNLICCSVTHELTPLFKIKGAVIYDVDGESAFFNPELRYNIQENLDVAIGSQLFAEQDDSEFQDYENFHYLELKYFF